MADLAQEDHLITAEGLAQMPLDDRRVELVAGEVVEMAPVNTKHVWLSGKLIAWIHIWMSHSGIGGACGGELGMVVRRNPDTVRAPDVAWLGPEETRRSLDRPGFTDEVPALVVEVVSPSETFVTIDGKVADYQAAGVPLIWIINPRDQRAYVHRVGHPIQMLTPPAALEGHDLLPGLSIPLDHLFDPNRHPPTKL